MLAEKIIAQLQGKKVFPAGIHPPYYKELSASAPIRSVKIPEEIILLAQQHIGSPARFIVKRTDEVKRAQLIAEKTGFVSAAVHSPVDGRVFQFTTVETSTAKRCEAVIIKPLPVSEGDLDNFLEYYLRFEENTKPVDEYSPEQIVDIVGDAGIVGMGGASFPTHVKLKVRPGCKIDTLILNGCECEPYITADDRLMQQAAHQILRGMQLAMRAVGAERGYVAIEDNKPKAIEKMTLAVKESGVRNVEVAICKSQYPMGGEKQLIKAVLGRVVPMGKLPLDVGVVVVNVATACSIANAIDKSLPLIYRVVTVTGLVEKPSNFLAPIGTPIGYLIEQAGGLKEDAGRVILGGPMMGVAVSDLTLPLTKGMNSITVLPPPEEFQIREYSCIRCARCVDHCPMGLNPTKIAHAAKYRDYELMRKYDLQGCIECGCCSYVCPSKIPLVQYIKTGKFLLARTKNNS